MLQSYRGLAAGAANGTAARKQERGGSTPVTRVFVQLPLRPTSVRSHVWWGLTGRARRPTRTVFPRGSRIRERKSTRRPQQYRRRVDVPLNSRPVAEIGGSIATRPVDIWGGGKLDGWRQCPPNRELSRPTIIKPCRPRHVPPASAPPRSTGPRWCANRAERRGPPAGWAAHRRNPRSVYAPITRQDDPGTALPTCFQRQLKPACP